MSEDFDVSLLDELMEAGKVDEDDSSTVEEPSASINFQMSQYVLSALLKKVNFSIPIKDWRPVERNFCVMVLPGRIRIVATNGEFTTSVESTKIQTQSTGVVLLPAREWLEVVKTAAPGELKVSVETERLIISQERTQWEIPLHRQAAFPWIPNVADVNLVEVNREALLKAIQRVRYAVGVQESQPGLRMIYIKDGKVTASDGERFQQTSIDSDVEVKIPSACLVDVVRVLEGSAQEEVRIGEEDKQICITDGSDVYWFNKVKAKFANAENFILKPALYNNRELHVGRSDLMSAIRRVRMDAGSNSAIGLFLTRGQIAVSARNSEGGKATEFIDAKWLGGRERVVVVNHIFLMELLNMHPDEECKFLLGDDSRQKRHPLLLRDEATGTVGLIQQMHGGRAAYDKL